MNHLFRILTILMKLPSQLFTSLNSIASPIIKSNVIKTTSRFTLLFCLLYIINWYYNILTLVSLFYFLIILTTSYLFISTITSKTLQIKSWISGILNGILEGFGTFNNTMHPDERSTEEINQEREIRQQKEIQDWRNKLQRRL